MLCNKKQFEGLNIFEIISLIDIFEKTQGPCEDPNLPPEYMSWDYDSKSGLLKHRHSGLCLKVGTASYRCQSVFFLLQRI